MTNIILILIVPLLIVAMFAYLEREAKRRDRAEKDRFREFVLAVKSSDVHDYNYSLPADDAPLPEQQEDELVDLDQVDPSTLIKVIKKHENYKN